MSYSHRSLRLMPLFCPYFYGSCWTRTSDRTVMN
nr:MAG TPA: hypothetical protein [Caudoviricetes sp.]